MKVRVGDLRKVIAETISEMGYYRDPYHPNYDEGEADAEEIRHMRRTVEECKERLTKALDEVEKHLGSDAAVVEELRNIMFDLHDLTR